MVVILYRDFKNIIHKKEHCNINHNNYKSNIKEKDPSDQTKSCKLVNNDEKFFSERKSERALCSLLGVLSLSTKNVLAFLQIPGISRKVGLLGKLNKAFLNFLPIFFTYLIIL